jgi:type IV secretion system protein VirB6
VAEATAQAAKPSAVPLAVGANPETPSGSVSADARLLRTSAVVLMVSTLGVLLAAKVVLALLLAIGPLFITLFLFDSTRGVFVGWVRATVAFAVMPLAVTVLLGLSLDLLAPWLDQLEAMREQNAYTPGVAVDVLILVLIFAAVSAGMVIAAGLIASGFKLTGGARTSLPPVPPWLLQDTPAVSSRIDRLAASLVAQDRRDGAIFFPGGAQSDAAANDRRIVMASGPETTVASVATSARLGQAPRRTAKPRASRAGVNTPTMSRGS